MQLLGYIENNLIALDQLFNTLLLGYPDETLSSRAYRADRAGKVFGKLFRPLIDGIFFWQISSSKDEHGIPKSHCWQAYTSERTNKQLPLDFRD